MFKKAAKSSPLGFRNSTIFGGSSCGTQAPEHGLSNCGTWVQLLCSMQNLPRPGMESMFPDQGSNLCPLYWQEDSYPLHHQGSPRVPSLGLCLYQEHGVQPLPSGSTSLVEQEKARCGDTPENGLPPLTVRPFPHKSALEQAFVKSWEQKLELSHLG